MSRERVVTVCASCKATLDKLILERDQEAGWAEMLQRQKVDLERRFVEIERDVERSNKALVPANSLARKALDIMIAAISGGKTYGSRWGGLVPLEEWELDQLVRDTKGDIDAWRESLRKGSDQ